MRTDAARRRGCLLSATAENWNIEARRVRPMHHDASWIRGQLPKCVCNIWEFKLDRYLFQIYVGKNSSRFAYCKYFLWRYIYTSDLQIMISWRQVFSDVYLKYLHRHSHSILITIFFPLLRYVLRSVINEAIEEYGQEEIGFIGEVNEKNKYVSPIILFYYTCSMDTRHLKIDF